MKGVQSIVAPKSEDGLVGCNNCPRTFAQDRIEKHRDVCLKTSNIERKTFDMTKKRTEGTDAEGFVPLKGKRGIAGKKSNVGSTRVPMSKQVLYCLQ